MSQFIVVSTHDAVWASMGLKCRELDGRDGFFRDAVVAGVGSWRTSFLLTDAQAGAAEPIVDELWADRSASLENSAARLMVVLRSVAMSGGWFLIWHGNDFVDLPIVHSWTQAVAALTSQTRHQPADVFLRFVTRDAGVSR